MPISISNRNKLKLLMARVKLLAEDEPLRQVEYIGSPTDHMMYGSNFMLKRGKIIIFANTQWDMQKIGTTKYRKKTPTLKHYAILFRNRVSFDQETLLLCKDAAE